MKNLKILGLIAAAAATLTVVLGASAASATVLCKNNLNTAACTEKIAAETILRGFQQPFTNQIFESLAGEQLAKCTQGGGFQFRAESAGSGATTVFGPLPALEWGLEADCQQVTQTIKPGKMEIHHIASTDDGTVTASGMEITFMLETTDCIYGTGAGSVDFGKLEGGKPAAVVANAVLTEQGTKKLACPDSVRFTGTYDFLPPPYPENLALYVAAA